MNSFSGFQPKFAFSLSFTARSAWPSRESVDSTCRAGLSLPKEASGGRAVGGCSAASWVGVSKVCPEKEHVVTEAPQRSGGQSFHFPNKKH